MQDRRSSLFQTGAFSSYAWVRQRSERLSGDTAHLMLLFSIQQVPQRNTLNTPPPLPDPDVQAPG